MTGARLMRDDIGQIRVVAARAFRRAGIQFAAGVNELDVLDLTAAQIVAIAGEPALVLEGRLGADDEWRVLPLPSPADLPAIEAELELAKAGIADMRMASLAAPVPDGADQPAAPDAPATTDKPESEGGAASAEADTPVEVEAGATSAPASGTKPAGKPTK